ncbi:hypothetical protein VB713_26095 [Anabaena cylindrica UHCC 0172]|uniref:hypothetical protein n=1 Tax=Anabaena cylindrica TaxID=1165 RepID=UPI002B209A8B|nr:hypothetical protein [Anabaena cylindrica]MEA5554410.1 hypothetical protein [Anabaena cylindrica UHCC 0172]
MTIQLISNFRDQEAKPEHSQQTATSPAITVKFLGSKLLQDQPKTTQTAKPEQLIDPNLLIQNGTNPTSIILATAFAVVLILGAVSTLFIAVRWGSANNSLSNKDDGNDSSALKLKFELERAKNEKPDQ